MVAGKHKSNTLRKVYVKTPGGKTTTHYRNRKPAKPKCGNCGAVLKGVARERPYKMKKMAKTKKRPTRPYAGVLCSKCLRRVMVDKARSK